MAMPHEPTFHQAGWQARDVFNIVVSAAEFAREPRARRYLRLLAVLAAPVANARGDGPTEGRSLDVWGEWERLRQATDRARDVVNETGAPWAVVRLVPPTAESLRRALVPRDPGYQVLHLSCHGSPSGLTLEDTLGRERLLPTDDLVATLRTTTVRLVVLNACSTAELGQALVERAGVPCVIATREPIDDREARLLSEQLYGDLAAGACVGEALQQTQNTIIEQMRAGDLRVPGTPEARTNNLLLFGDSGLRLDPGDEAASAPCFILHPVPHNHPLPFEKVSGFVGRADELVELAWWFEQTGRRAFLISGVGGIGKTALALNAALRHSYRFRALAFASAKDLPEFGALQVLQALNEALSITTTLDEAANLPGAIARRLNTNAVLLILDNLETLALECMAELAHALAGLDPHNGSRVLMTLRPLEHGPLTALADRRDRRDLGRYDLEPSVRAYLERRRPPAPAEWRRYCLSHAEAHLVVIADYNAAIREGRMTYSAPLEWSNVAAAVHRLAELMPTDDAAARVLVAYAQHWRNVLSKYGRGPHL
jgi:hypothetical protein